jgi:putative dimethyl sulfoxide reductase chaperone
MLNELLIEPLKVSHGETPPALPTELLVDELNARADVYRLLAGVFVEEPSSEFLDALREPAMLQQLAEAGLHFDGDFTEASIDVLVEQLAIEYTTLFANSGGFPPVESVRLFGRFKQEPNFETMQTYRRLGFVLRPGRFEVFADQIGVELMFVAELLDRSATALASGDAADAKRLEKEIKRFWVQHLGRWARGYAQLIERTAEHSFYREMARFLAGFAAEEIEAMELRVEDADQARLVVPKAEVKVEFNPDEPVCNGCVSEAIAQQPGVQPLHDLR